MINIKTSTPNGHRNTRQLSIYTVSIGHFCHPEHGTCSEKGSTNWKKKGGWRGRAGGSVVFPTLWNNSFHSQDDLSWQIGSSGCLASWPQKVHFLTSVLPSCWQANATNQCNKTSMGFRIRVGNCNDSRRIRCEVCPTFKSESCLQKRTNSSLEGG